MKRRIVVAIAVVFVFVFALSACGSRKAASGSPLVIGVAGSLSSLDVNQEAGILNYYVTALAQEGLVGVNNDGELIPTLAESWTDEEQTVWKFKIRQGVTFSDGTPLTADDVVYSIENAMDPTASPGVAIYFPDYVEKAEATADDEVTVTLDGPHANFIISVSNTGGLFVRPRAWGESADAPGSPQDLLVGTGPYTATEFEPGSHATFTANEKWWGGEVALKEVRFDFFADENTRLLAFTQGDVNFALNVPVDQSEQWEKVDGATVQFLNDRNYYGLTFDPNVAPFDEEHVRKAVAYAIDKEGIVNGSILKGHGTPATAIPAPEQFAVAMDAEEAAAKLAEVTHYDFDLSAAKAELAQSSVPNGFEATITYPDSYPTTGQASLVLADALKDLGITLHVKEIPLDQWLNEIGGGQGVGWMIYGPTTLEPGEITMWLLDAEGPGYNPANWTNEEVTALTMEVFGAPDFAAQIEPTLKSNSIAQEQAIYAPVWWGQAAIAYQGDTQVKDYNSMSLLGSNWPQLFVD
ncbi:ABC transporter substrate-binding protein [Clostridia bacterium]|nr:ABC transporter substrate-binding protein [Clostridia bacterium]